MNPAISRWAGWAMVVALVASLALLFTLSTGKVLVSQRGALGGTLVRAEFKNSWPLVAGMSVRVSGTVTGSVQSVTLTDRGTSEVELRLARGVPAPRADATAAIRQQDVLGDTYVALSLGRDDAPLRGTIPTDKTVTMPRLDEVFSTLREPERAAIKATVISLSQAVDGRGDDLNAAILKLRPGIEALDQLLSELDGQESDLRAVVEDSQRLTHQLAAGKDDLDAGLTSLRDVLVTTAAHNEALNRTLAGAPAAVRTTGSLLRRTGAVARRGRPVAVRLQRAAPELRRIAPLVEPFAKDAAVTMRKLSPVFRQLRATLIAARPVTAQLKDLDPVDVLLPASGLLEVLSPVFGDGAKALFGADTYGKDGRGQTGLGAVAVERGDQPTTPGEDPRRTWLRTAVVLNCETFGRPVQPGCLAEYLHDGGLSIPGVGQGASSAALQATKSAAIARRREDTQTELMEYLLR